MVSGAALLCGRSLTWFSGPPVRWKARGHNRKLRRVIPYPRTGEGWPFPWEFRPSLPLHLVSELDSGGLPKLIPLVPVRPLVPPSFSPSLRAEFVRGGELVLRHQSPTLIPCLVVCPLSRSLRPQFEFSAIHPSCDTWREFLQLLVRAAKDMGGAACTPQGEKRGHVGMLWGQIA